MSGAPPLLELRGISKDFPGTRALDGVDLVARPGEVLCLLGENGAGKSTLMKILSGVWPHGTYEGEMRFAGKACEFRDTRDAHASGIAMIHQELSVFPELTVAEHLELSQLPRWLKWDELFARVQGFLDRLNLGLKADARVGSLSVGGRQLVEIARALYREARVLIFDEPTSALTEQEVQRLYAIIERLRAEGRAIIYITHRMDEVFRLADRMVVLRDGRNAGECGRGDDRKELEAKLITWMVGRPIQNVYPQRNRRLGGEALRVEGLRLLGPGGKRLVSELSFSVREGEVLGLAGLLGAGRSETFEALFGAYGEPGSDGPKGPGYAATGELWIRGSKRLLPRRPAEAIALGMALVSEDRKGSGLVLGQSIRANASLPMLAARQVGRARGRAPGDWLARLRLDGEAESEGARAWMRNLRIRAAGEEQAVGELSGGNQQKVVLAKWLRLEPRILLLDEPTRGIDVGAKAEIYGLIQELAAGGMAIVVASSEMVELLGLCHRILVLREGRSSAELSAPEATQEDIMRAACL